MNWHNAKTIKAPTNVRLWVMTLTGERVQAYLNEDDEWIILCPRVARLNPEVVKWSDEL